MQYILSVAWLKPGIHSVGCGAGRGHPPDPAILLHVLMVCEILMTNDAKRVVQSPECQSCWLAIPPIRMVSGWGSAFTPFRLNNPTWGAGLAGLHRSRLGMRRCRHGTACSIHCCCCERILLEYPSTHPRRRSEPRSVDSLCDRAIPGE